MVVFDAGWWWFLFRSRRRSGDFVSGGGFARLSNQAQGMEAELGRSSSFLLGFLQGCKVWCLGGKYGRTPLSTSCFIHYGLRFFCSRYNGAEGLHTKVTEFVRDKDYVVCGPSVIIELDTSVTLQKVQSRNVKLEFKLAIGFVDNIVAFGTIVEVDVEATQQTIHGVPLGEKNVRVSVTEAVVANALLPFPIKDEIVRVADAIGTCCLA